MYAIQQRQLQINYFLLSAIITATMSSLKISVDRENVLDLWGANLMRNDAFLWYMIYCTVMWKVDNPSARGEVQPWYTQIVIFPQGYKLPQVLSFHFLSLALFILTDALHVLVHDASILSVAVALWYTVRQGWAVATATADSDGWWHV